MRRATHDYSILNLDDGTFIGYCLGFDFCAEHESSIRGLRSEFGMPEEKVNRDNYGIRYRTATEVPQFVTWFESTNSWDAVPEGKKRKKKMSDKFGYLIVRDSYSRPLTPADINSKYLDSLLEATIYWRVEDMSCAWDEKSFGIRVRGETNIQNLKKLYEAILKKDVCVFPGGNGKGNPFSRPGLVVAIRSLIPDEFAKLHDDSDLETIEVREAFEATEIEKTLKEAGKGWFALSPKFHKNEDGSRKLMVWLNPYEQNRYNSCWCSIDDLKDWAANKGKVIKTNEQRTQR